jgi:hypothetical protein
MAVFRPIQISMPYTTKDGSGAEVTKYNNYNVGKAWQREYKNDEGKVMVFYDGKIELFPKTWDGRFSLGLPIDTQAKAKSAPAVPVQPAAEEISVEDIPF